MNNLGLIPLVPSDIGFSRGTVLSMINRVIIALKQRLGFPYENLHEPSTFTDFCYHLLDGFQNRERFIQDRFPDRFVNSRWQMPATFGELVRCVRGQKITDFVMSGALGLVLSEGDFVQAYGKQIIFGPLPVKVTGNSVNPQCRRFLPYEDCPFDLVRGVAIGQRILTLGDWGDRLELGLSNRVKLTVSAAVLHVDYDPPISLSRFG